MREISQRNWKRAFCGFGLLTALATTGCQSDIAGQTLPSPYYQQDDIQYFAPGPEFKLSREAAAQKAFSTEQAELAAPGGVGNGAPAGLPGFVPAGPNGAAPDAGGVAPPPVPGPRVPAAADAMPAEEAP